MTIDPLTFVLHPVKELAVSLYFRWFSKSSIPTLPSEEDAAIETPVRSGSR